MNLIILQVGDVLESFMYHRVEFPFNMRGYNTCLFYPEQPS